MAKGPWSLSWNHVKWEEMSSSLCGLEYRKEYPQPCGRRLGISERNPQNSYVYIGL